MPNFELTSHAKAMLLERKFSEDWLWRTINTPDSKQMGDDGNLHFSKAITENEERILHIVVNANVYPNRIVIVFFDCRLGRRNETENR